MRMRMRERERERERESKRKRESEREGGKKEKDPHCLFKYTLRAMKRALFASFTSNMTLTRLYLSVSPTSSHGKPPALNDPLVWTNGTNDAYANATALNAALVGLNTSTTTTASAAAAAAAAPTCDVSLPVPHCKQTCGMWCWATVRRTIIIINSVCGAKYLY